MTATLEYTAAEVVRVRLAARLVLAAWRARGRDPDAAPRAFGLAIERRARVGVFGSARGPRGRGAGSPGREGR